MSWGKIVIENSDFASNLVNEVQEKFELCWRAHGSADEAALFSEIEQDSRNRIIYLSPKAFEIGANALKSFNPVACPKPSELKSWLSANPGARSIFDVVGTDR